MTLQFIPVNLDNVDQYYSFWHSTPRHSLDYTLANLWGWQKYYGLEWAFTEDICWIRQTRPKPLLWAPLGNWKNVEWPQLFGNIFTRDKVQITRVPEELANMWQEAMPSAIDVAEDRGQWEYLYAREELATLSGNRFHKKRNHYNSYVKAYGEPDYKPVSPDMIKSVLTMQDDWCQTHECEDSPSLTAENEAIQRVLAHWDVFQGLCGGTLLLENRVIAFSVGEPLDDSTLGVHFEKGLQGYKGVYQAINLEFARNAGAGFKWINRAQDLDEEGLRQAKLTYQPVDFLRKFKITYNH